MSKGKKVSIGVVGILALISVAAGIYVKVKKVTSIAIIGGADGPTSIFVAGKVNSAGSLLLIAVGIILLAGILLWCRAKK